MIINNDNTKGQLAAFFYCRDFSFVPLANNLLP